MGWGRGSTVPIQTQGQGWQVASSMCRVGAGWRWGSAQQSRQAGDGPGPDPAMQQWSKWGWIRLPLLPCHRTSQPVELPVGQVAWLWKLDMAFGPGVEPPLLYATTQRYTTTLQVKCSMCICTCIVSSGHIFL